MITKSLIREKVIEIFGSPVITENDPSEEKFGEAFSLTPNDYFKDYFIDKFTKSSIFYLALNRSFTFDFSGQLSYLLNESVSKTNPDYLVLNDRRVHGNTYKARVTNNKQVTERTYKELIIVGTDIKATPEKPLFYYTVTDTKKVDSTVLLVSNTIGQPSYWFTDEMFDNLYQSQALGVEKIYMVGLLADLDVSLAFDDEKIINKYFHQAQGRVEKNSQFYYVKEVNKIREMIRPIDENYEHLIFGGMINNIKIYVHAFIVELNKKVVFNQETNKIEVE